MLKKLLSKRQAEKGKHHTESLPGLKKGKKKRRWRARRKRSNLGPRKKTEVPATPEFADFPLEPMA